MTTSTPAPRWHIDPFAPAWDGVYRDGLVEVRAMGPTRPRRTLHSVRTEHFDLRSCDGLLQVAHNLRVDRIDDDLAGLLAEELFAPGWVRGPELFERIFTGIVRSVDADPLGSWEVFYRNTLRRIGQPPRQTAGPAPGTIDGYAPVYRHAIELTGIGSVLELGCCFGFLSLLLGQEHPTTASDVNAGSIELLTAVASRLGIELRTQIADAARYPAESGCADTVLAIHLVEHLEPRHGDQVIAECLRLAHRRLIVAVPLEDEADETYGHVRTVDLAALRRWGRSSGARYDVHEFHGGWLVVDLDDPLGG